MSFIKNAWYCAGFSSDLTSNAELYTIKILDEPLVLYRTSAGVVALNDRCPHRFAPLSKGKLCEQAIQCGYHGLVFDATGKCIKNPHGPIPPAAKVKAYPVLERHSALWVWMGEPANADPAQLPDFGSTEEGPRCARVIGRLHIKANYQLVTDNLLDLSHVPFLHPFLANAGPPPEGFSAKIKTDVVGSTVHAINEFAYMPTSEFYRMLWERGPAPPTCDMRANMRWNAPALMLLDTGATPHGESQDMGPTSMQGHWLTPESELTTHYFWAVGRDRFVGDPAMSERVRAGVDSAFRSEDEPMIEAVQSRMGGSDLWAHEPLLFATDTAAVRARRIVEKMISSEQKGRVSDEALS
jgi:phenylpropionate dioxygenase-like ring-hydroxylating dioxygenase large terminal subunit